MKKLVRIMAVLMTFVPVLAASAWDGQSWVCDASARTVPEPDSAEVAFGVEFEGRCGDLASGSLEFLEARTFTWGRSNDAGLDGTRLSLLIVFR